MHYKAIIVQHNNSNNNNNTKVNFFAAVHTGTVQPRLGMGHIKMYYKTV